MTKIIAGKDFAKEIENKNIEILENGLVKVLEPKVWKPRVGKDYFYLNHNGLVYRATWQGDELDFYRLYNGNVFRTEKIARKVSKITFKFKKLEYEELVDWEDKKQKKFYLYYSYAGNKLCLGFQEQYKDQNDDCFKDLNKLDNLIDEVGEADVIKYYLRIGVNE